MFEEKYPNKSSMNETPLHVRGHQKPQRLPWEAPIEHRNPPFSIPRSRNIQRL